MTSLKVIVVDDNHTNRLLPGLFLRPLGHEVQECDSAEQAMAWLAHNHCDVVLLDISMPTVSGLQLCQQLRQDDLPPSSRTNVMFVKSVTMENDGHEEEQIYRRTDHWVLAASRSRHADQGVVPQRRF